MIGRATADRRTLTSSRETPSSAKKSPARLSRELDDLLQFVSPTPVAEKELNLPSSAGRTRSGRHSIRPLAFWRNERVETDAYGNILAVNGTRSPTKSNKAAGQSSLKNDERVSSAKAKSRKPTAARKRPNADESDDDLPALRLDKERATKSPRVQRDTAESERAAEPDNQEDAPKEDTPPAAKEPTPRKRVFEKRIVSKSTKPKVVAVVKEPARVEKPRAPEPRADQPVDGDFDFEEDDPHPVKWTREVRHSCAAIVC